MRERFLGLINKYRILRSQRDSGRISDDEYRRQLEASAIPDAENPNCWWNISPESGLWIYFDGKEWTPRAPEGFDPDVGPLTPVPTKTTEVRRGVGAKTVAVVVIAIVVVAVAITATLIIMQQIAAPGGGGQAQNEIENVIDDFYSALDTADATDLTELSTGSLARQIKREQESGTLNNFTQQYRGIDYDIREIEIKNDGAEATVQLDRGGRTYEQKVELELINGKWKVADLGDVRLATQRPTEREGNGETDRGSREDQVSRVAEQFFQAYRALDTFRMREFLTGSALQEFDEFEAALQDRSQYENTREMVAGLTWEILSVSLNNAGDRATVRVKVSLSDEPMRLQMKLESGRWMITESGSGSS